MIIKIELPENLPEGHGASFKKGIAESLLEFSKTPMDKTPNGHGLSRSRGVEVGKKLAREIAEIVKKPKK